MLDLSRVKPGDRVLCIRSCGDILTIGKMYEITEVTNGYNWVFIYFNDDNNNNQKYTSEPHK